MFVYDYLLEEPFEGLHCSNKQTSESQGPKMVPKRPIETLTNRIRKTIGEIPKPNSRSDNKISNGLDERAIPEQAENIIPQKVFLIWAREFHFSKRQEVGLIFILFHFAHSIEIDNGIGPQNIHHDLQEIREKRYQSDCLVLLDECCRCFEDCDCHFDAAPFTAQADYSYQEQNRKHYSQVLKKRW